MWKLNNPDCDVVCSSICNKNRHCSTKVYGFHGAFEICTEDYYDTTTRTCRSKEVSKKRVGYHLSPPHLIFFFFFFGAFFCCQVEKLAEKNEKMVKTHQIFFPKKKSSNYPNGSSLSTFFFFWETKRQLLLTPRNNVCTFLVDRLTKQKSANFVGIIKTIECLFF